MDADELRCRHCGHSPEQHDNFGECHVTILTGWDEKIQHFTGHRLCGCTEYAGRYKMSETDPGACPHEAVPTSPNCVHCGRQVKENKQ